MQWVGVVDGDENVTENVYNVCIRGEMCVYVEKTKIENKIETIERMKEKEASNDV